MVWYDANPSDLNDLPPEMTAKKYVKYMSGEAAILRRAKADWAKGDRSASFCDAVVHAIAGAHVDTQLPNAISAKLVIAKVALLGSSSERRHGFWHTAVLLSASHHLSRSLRAVQAH
ncbi:hypothetical protein JJQ59_36230 (plasmid) [Cupriavidus necator]|uniref:Alkyl sulfatase dimerisation domain-containing protein n=1 Tax=Cupriavidus necator TaxID=106590 RepID=A0A367P6S8_CUPNE|nr:hypothetical protein JJQ59_36230 [Cupriavidus necator]RCJ03274.1 hypothetical protein DDK22_38200 [Cupriavidus necator]